MCRYITDVQQGRVGLLSARNQHFVGFVQRKYFIRSAKPPQQSPFPHERVVYLLHPDIQSPLPVPEDEPRPPADEACTQKPHSWW